MTGFQAGLAPACPVQKSDTGPIRVRKTRESPAGRGGAEEAFEKIPRGGAGPGQQSNNSGGAGRARDSDRKSPAGRGGAGRRGGGIVFSMLIRKDISNVTLQAEWT